MERRLAVIVAADVVGYSALMERDEAGTLERLKAGRKELFEPEIERRLLQATDMLAESVAVCEQLIREIAARRHGPVPLGINIESVSIRRTDIAAAVALVEFAARALSS